VKRLAAIVVAGAIALIAPVSAFAAPPAGTVIGNQATATYNDAGGNARTTTSNLVQTTVTQVKSFTLTANGARTAAPGQTIYYPHTITNTGNGTDTYTLNAPVSSSFGVGPHASLAYYIDANGDGLPDNATPITSTGALAAGGVFRFVVAGTVPAGASSGNTATITVSVSDTTPSTSTNTDTTTVANSVINVTKSLSSTSGTSPSGPITVTLSYINTGSAVANNVQITDALASTLTYVAGSGRWSVSGAAALTDANDGVEQSASFPPGIDFRSSLGAGATVIAIIPSVAAGASGNVSFQVNVNANLTPQTITNTAQFQTATQPSANSNTSSFQVLQGASVVANGSATSATNGAAEPVTIASAAAGATISFNDYVWNHGNGSDTFDMTVAANTFPAGSTVTLLQQDGATPLINSGGSPAPDTGPIPGAGQACAAPFVADTSVTPNLCGYRVVVRVTLPANAPNAAVSLTLRATSVFSNTTFDDVVDTLSAVTANTVDVTNDRAAPPAGTAAAADGLAATGATIIRTNAVTPGAAPLTTRFRTWITNTGAVSSDFNLASTFAATSAPGVTPPALPAGWSVVFRADASGAAADCSTVGAVITSTGAIAAGAARLVCAEITVPALSGALAGSYDFDFTATSTTNNTIVDSVRDRVQVNAVRNMTFTGTGSQQTFANGTVTYTHTLTNLGNATDTASFAGGCLSDSRAANGWTSAAFIDANANGTLDGADQPIVCGTTVVSLLPGEARAVFVRVTAPATATPADPANVTTLTATNVGPLSVTDSTTVIGGLQVTVDQQALGAAGCANNNAPAGSYSTAVIPASPSTAPGACIAYRVTVTNTSAAAITAISLGDAVPANTHMHYACSGNGASAPSVTVGSIVGTTPADGATGTVTANVGSLNAAQSAVMYFCVQVDAATAPGTTLNDQASGSGTQAGNSTTVPSNIATAVVGTAAGGTYSGVLAASTRVVVNPGAVVLIPHTLTNTGSTPDNFSIALTEQPNGFAFTTFGIFPDANNDGVPDSLVPIANPIALNPGQVLHFVFRGIVPTSGIAGYDDVVRFTATSTGGAAVVPMSDTVSLFAQTPADCASAAKILSRDRGPSPSAPVTVNINYFPCDKARSKVTITDLMPAGMHYVAGSARWTGTGSTPLTDAIVGDDRQGTGATQIAFDFGQTTANAVTAVVYNLAAQQNGSLTFQVTIDPGLADNTIVTNTASYVFSDAAGNWGLTQTSSATYVVSGKVDLDFTGQRIASAAPGTTLTFTNVLTNKGEATDTFDILLGTSTFPAGTTIQLYKSDGVTPLADTDGNGTPDTGPLAPGATYNVIVKVNVPATTPPGAYKVSKTARSVTAPSRFITVDDSVDAITQSCKVSLDPDNQALIGRGQHVTYPHFLTNRGNCQETVTAMVNYLGDSKPGWNSAAYLDNPVAGAGSIPGVVDRTDTQVVQGWTRVLAPGESVRVLVDVRAPGVDASAKKASTKQLVDSDVTTLVITGLTVGPLVVHDTTLLDDQDIAQQPANAIRNFTDSSLTTPSAWGVIGRSLYLRADAAACNADPTVAESRTVVITGPNGEREQATATETGPNTGIFVVPALPIRGPPVVAGDNILEGNPNDVFTIDLQGCGQTIANVVTLMTNSSVVFDSRSNDPIAGASVSLVAATAGRCGTTPVSLGSGNSNPIVTGADGRFSFTAPTGDYCLAVAAPNGYKFPSQVSYTQLPAGHNLNVTGPTSGGSYGNPFHVAADGAVIADIPVDITAQSGLFVQKDASKSTAEVGDFVDYTVTVKNSTGNALNRADVILTDSLPTGFAYVKGTARRDGSALADPAGGTGPSLAFTLGHFDAGAQSIVTYRVRIAPQAMKGDGVNRAQAFYNVGGTVTASNVAVAKVQVTGGVFSDKGFILGKIFLDCNANGVQDKGEEGVGGVRILLEDGTYAITDGQGKFSFYGIDDRTHVVKADRTTLPQGATLEVISQRNLGDPGSRIVDLKSGELARADFAITGCDESVRAEVAARRAAAEKAGDDLAAIAGAQLTTEPRVVSDVKALPASGVVERLSSPATPGATPAVAPGANAPYQSLAPAGRIGDTLPTPAPGIGTLGMQPAPLEPLEKLVAGFENNDLAILDLKDGETLAYAQSSIRVKGVAGTTFKLAVNGEAVSERAVGKRSTLAEKQVQAWEFVGVNLKAGDNTITVTQVDSFGNERGSVTVHVVAPGHLGKLFIDVPAAGGVADGKTPVSVVIRLADDNGVPITARTPVTLESTRGRWIAEDMDPKAPGLQVFVENGRGEFKLVPTLEPGENMVYASSGGLKAQARLDFLPELRQMVATGVIEGIINARNINTRALVPARASDGFDQELQHLSRDWDNGRTDAGVRAAFYLKGKIKGDYLLTAAYDSDKDTQQRLFRDIQPDEFYPVYGDSAVRGFDAQSTSKLYVRIDKNRSYLLWGDFNTNSASETRKLTNYTRSITGLKEHYENSRVSVNAFASRDTTRQVIEELKANGTSGPFQLSNAGALLNSETIEIVTRDRNQPAMIISRVPMTRFSDYEVEALTGRILFKSPIPSVDQNLNPNFVRVTYEIDQGGPEFWVAGIDGQVKVTDNVELGGIYVKDKNPLAPFTLGGANLVVKLGASTYVITEIARSQSGIDDVKGNAGRIELKHESKDLKADIFIAHTDVGFENPGSYLIEGRSESGGKLDYKLTDKANLHAEALRTEDVASGSRRDGASVGVQYKLSETLTMEVGMRHSAEKGDVSPVPALPGQPAPEPLPDSVTTVRAKVTGQVPQVKGLSVYGEAEVDVKDADKKIIAAGAEYQMENKSRIYARHEFISSITGPYGLNPNERQNSTAIGIDTEYMKDGRFYSEYRVRDAIDGGDTEAALGLKNLWSIAPGLKLGTTFERVHTLAGTGTDENTAVALALEYTANPNWKASSRLELRDGSTQDSLLFTVGLAAKLSRDWTALARNAYTLTKNKTGDGEHLIDRMQAGLAWRDNETNKWNVLARVESRTEHDDTTPAVLLRNSTQIVSINADWQLSRPFLVTGRYAAKWSTDGSDGLTTRYHAQVVGARATWEFASKWDMGLVTSAVVGGPGTTSRQYGVGLEVGYNVATNLWVSAGYNFFGYKDTDLAQGDYTVKGPYVRLRYKFDESAFGDLGQAPAKAAPVSSAVTTSESRDAGQMPAPAPAPAGGYVPIAPSGGAAAAGSSGGGPL
jgi:uncharacterized repeat protein (TIGR01451 family)